MCPDVNNFFPLIVERIVWIENTVPHIQWRLDWMELGGASQPARLGKPAAVFVEQSSTAVLISSTSYRCPYAYSLSRFLLLKKATTTIPRHVLAQIIRFSTAAKIHY